MLYCPKCRRTYQEGSQRFCSNDGGRLMAMPAGDKTAGESAQGVFSNLLSRNAQKYDADEKISPKPAPAVRPQPQIFAETEKRNGFESKTHRDMLPAAKTPINEQKPLARLIRPHEIPSSTAELGDRRKFPTGRLAMSWDNPNVLLGQTVKGRYYVEEKIAQDESSVTFLASDKILMGKRVVVKILMDESDKGNFQNNQSVEERVALSHINHPHIASLFDSGELVEGKPFLITEYTEGKSLRDLIRRNEPINLQRAGRIIRQISYALSDAHHNGVLHRNLRPDKIILGISEIGSEQIKVTDFNSFALTSIRNQTPQRIPFWSPEQIEGKPATFSSDIYSLGVIAYLMFTGKLPFAFSSAKELLDAQKKSLLFLPSALRTDLPKQIDSMIQRALNYDPAERYPRARDFGEAIFGALSEAPADESLFENAHEKAEGIAQPGEAYGQISSDIHIPATHEPIAKPDIELEKNEAAEEAKEEAIRLEIPEPEGRLSIAPKFGSAESSGFSLKESAKSISEADGGFAGEMEPAEKEGLPWKQRSTEPPRVVSFGWLLMGLLGTILIIAAAIGAWRFYLNRQAVNPDPLPAAIENSPPTISSNSPASANAASNSDQANSATTEDEPDIPPPQRQINPPAGYSFYQNTKEGMSETMLKNFRGFSLYYPQNWTKLEKKGENFIDIVKPHSSGLPMEQMLVTWYPSKGTYKGDIKSYPALTEKVKKEILSFPKIKNFVTIDEGKRYINENRKVYEMRFQCDIVDGKGEPVKLWGRTFFVPAQRVGIKHGLRVTLLATSLSEVVENIDDVGMKGELNKILNTFEPDQD